MSNKSAQFNREKKWPSNTFRLVKWLQKINEHYSSIYEGDFTIMFNNSKVAILFDGKLKESTSIKNLESIIK